jgi:hypothetical protein
VLREVETTLITIDAVRAGDSIDDLAAKRASRAS